MTVSQVFIVTAGVLISATAHAAERSYDLKDFTGVNVARGVDLEISSGPAAISAETNADDFSDLYVEVDDGVLEVRRKSAFSNKEKNRIRYTVTVFAPELDFLKASTGSVMKGENLQINTAEIKLDTGATMTLSGACDTIDVTANTGAEFDGRELLCASVTARGRTGAVIRARASEVADGKARMGAEIKFYGDPKTRKKGTFMGGEVSF